MKSADGSQLSLYRPTCLANFFSALRLRRANHKNLQLKAWTPRGPLVDPAGPLRQLRVGLHDRSLVAFKT